MNCAGCGTANEAGRKFCMECGAPLAKACPACGSQNPPAGKFCGECGSSLGEPQEQAAPPAATPSPPPAQGTTERRLVSVVFLDLVSFTTLSEQRDAEDMRALMDSYFATARTIIERHGGVVEKFIGDAVMSVWGTPVTYEDDAERAVRAALELIDGVAALGQAKGLPLQARAGVLTGEAATSASADNQGMVTGDMVNTASRLQSAAEPGQVLVGDPTYRAASRAIAFESAGQLALKGKEEPVPAWRAVRVVAERLGANRLAVEPPFVGRIEELRMLKDLLHATGREGKARVVSVTGIGGIGKSRLAWELAKYVDGLTEDIYWHDGRCPAYGEGIAFWALGEMVRGRAGIAETDPPGESRTKLGGAVAEYVADEEERRWLEPRLAFLLGLEERPQGGREELFAAWRLFFERIADRGTVVLVFEDLQWADAGLLDFIEALLEWSRGRPIFVLTLSRPELTDKRPTWGAGQRSFVGLHLESLPDEAIADLVRGMVPDASGDAVTRIVERAEGVPLYAVETIRMLADRGVLLAGETSYALVGDLGELHVPETLQALVAARLDALGPEDRSLLQDAAVLGKSFTTEALSAVAGIDTDALRQRLQDLVRKEFLAQEADPRSPERGQYAFVQAIIREVAYGMLAKADRRSRHLAAAHHFESFADDEIASAVASHYVDALEATPEGPDRDALAARARDWLGQAIERATALGSPEQALVLGDQALAITPSGAGRSELLRGAARAARDAMQRDRTLALLREAIAIDRQLGDVDAEVATMGELVVIVGNLGWADEARSLRDEMEERLGEGGDERARAYLEEARGFAAYFDGDLESCLTSLDRALASVDRADDRERFAHLLQLKANVLGFVGRRREATILVRGMLDVATDENDIRSMASMTSSLALAAEEQTEAVARGLESASIARRGGYRETEANALGNLAESAVEAGAWETADRVMEDLRARPEVTVGFTIADIVAITAALLAAYRGDIDGAVAAMEELSEEFRESPGLDTKAWHLRVRSVVKAMAGDLQGGYEDAMDAIRTQPGGPNEPLAVWTAGMLALWLREAAKTREPLDITTETRGGWFAATRAVLEAGVAALEGRAREAASGFERVLRDRLAKGDPFTHAIATTCAVAVLPAEQLPAGSVEAARAYLEELGAAALLARLTPVDAKATTHP